MRVIFLSSLSDFEYAMYGEIASQFDDCALVRLVSERPPTSLSTWRRTMRRPWGTAVSLLNYPAERARMKAFRRAAQQYRGQFEFAVETIDIPDWATNEPESVAQIAALKPDILIVSGAPILKPAVFSLPKLACVNVHFGIAPLYRGENTIFWPLIAGDYQNIGVTIHHIDEGIDTGEVLARGYLGLEPDDTELTLFAKATSMTTRLLIEILQAFESKVSPGTQWNPAGRHPPPLAESSSTLFLARDRTLAHDLLYVLRRRVMKKQLPTLQERVERYY